VAAAGDDGEDAAAAAARVAAVCFRIIPRITSTH